MDKKLKKMVEKYYPYVGGGRMVEVPQEETVDLEQKVKELRQDINYIMTKMTQLIEILTMEEPNGDETGK